jgi:hypothetical protein
MNSIEYGVMLDNFDLNLKGYTFFYTHCTVQGVYKNRNLGISQEIDIVLRTKDFRCLGI